MNHSHHLLFLLLFVFCNPLFSQNKNSIDSLFMDHLDGKNSCSLFVLDFWASFCSPCIKELPYLEHYSEIYKEDTTVLFAAVNSFEDEERVTKFISDHPIKTTCILDKDKEIANRYGIKIIPQTIIIDSDGNLRWRGNIGKIKADLLDSIIKTGTRISISPDADRYIPNKLSYKEILRIDRPFQVSIVEEHGFDSAMSSSFGASYGLRYKFFANHRDIGSVIGFLGDEFLLKPDLVFHGSPAALPRININFSAPVLKGREGCDTIVNFLINYYKISSKEETDTSFKYKIKTGNRTKLAAASLSNKDCKPQQDLIKATVKDYITLLSEKTKMNLFTSESSSEVYYFMLPEHYDRLDSYFEQYGLVITKRVGKVTKARHLTFPEIY